MLNIFKKYRFCFLYTLTFFVLLAGIINIFYIVRALPFAAFAVSDPISGPISGEITPTPTATPTLTLMPTPTSTPTPTLVPTLTPTPTSIPTSTPALTPIPTPTPDVTGPIVSITNPQDGGIVSKNSVVNISASASDPSGVAMVEFMINGITLCTDTALPYSCAWKVPPKAKVAYVLSAKAYDTLNNSTSTSIRVTSWK